MPRSMLADDAAEDAVLARRVVDGDTGAEATLCRRMLPRVRAWGLKHLRDETAARDLAQHVLLAVIEALRAGRVDELDRVGAFVLGVCRHTMFAWQRGERRRSTLLEQFGPTLADVAWIDDEALDGRRLDHCFERLTPRARAILALTFYAGRSGNEIASELGVSSGSVRVARHRALEQLLSCMEAGR